MKRIITLLVMMFALTGHVSAQEAKDKDEEMVINHTVELGETVLMICKKYVVLPQDFYKYNKEAIHGVKINEVLRIPIHKSKKKNLKDAYLKGDYANVAAGPTPSKAADD